MERTLNIVPSEGATRYERKFAVANRSLVEVQQLIKLHPAFFRDIFQQRAINNIYFDSLEWKHRCDSINGSENRLKIRIRWYGDLFGNITHPVLEFKWKHGLMVRKDSFPLEAFELTTGMNFDHVEHVLRTAHLPARLREEALAVKPVLVNRYLRKYLLSADKQFRVTLDSKLQFYRIRRYANSFLDRSINDCHIIVELKYGKDSDGIADQISSIFPFRMSRWSKFVAGLDTKYDG